MNFTEIRSSQSVSALVWIMAWCQSNDKHIYAKSDIDNRHIYVSLGHNGLTRYQKELMKNILIGFYFIAKHQSQKTKKIAVNIFHSATKYLVVWD